MTMRGLVIGPLVLSAVLGASVSTGCALFRSDFTIRVDSISVAPTSDARTFAVQVFGWVSDGCSKLRKVERSSRQDTLFRRLIAENTGGNCIQIPITIKHNEQVVVQPGRTTIYAVRQPDGSLLARAIGVP